MHTMHIIQFAFFLLKKAPRTIESISAYGGPSLTHSPPSFWKSCVGSWWGAATVRFPHGSWQ